MCVYYIYSLYPGSLGFGTKVPPRPPGLRSFCIPKIQKPSEPLKLTFNPATELGFSRKPNPCTGRIRTNREFARIEFPGPSLHYNAFKLLQAVVTFGLEERLNHEKKITQGRENVQD